MYNAIERQVAGTVPVPRLVLQSRDDSQPRVVDLLEARSIVTDREARPELRDAVWREVILLIRQDRAADPDHTWQLVALWLLLPGLRRTVARLSRLRRTEVDDLRSAALLGALETLHTAEPDRPGLAHHIWASAATSAWRAAKVDMRERPVEDVELVARHSPALPTDPPIDRGVLDVALHRAPTRAQRSGERLGSVAHRLGLDDHTSAARHCTRGRLVGRLSHSRGVTSLDHPGRQAGADAS